MSKIHIYPADSDKPLCELEQLSLRLASGRPLPSPRASRSTPDDQLEFVLAESLRMIKMTGCGCYLRAKMSGRRHNKRTCGCRCGHRKANKR